MTNPVSRETIRSALSFISPDLPREEWVRVGMAIKSELSEDGFELFDSWSQGGGSYDAAAVRDTWKSIKAGGKVKVGTLLRMAKGAGWEPDKGGGALPVEERARRSEAAAKRKREEEAEAKKKRDREAAVKRQCAGRWEGARPADPAHPYLKRKRIRPYGIRSEGDTLIVPLYSLRSGELWNLQAIYPEPRTIRNSGKPRDKDYPPGGRKSGLSLLLGEVEPRRPLVIVEGYATGATIHEATGFPVLVVFDCGNLKNVAAEARHRWPEVGFLFAADDDYATRNNPGKTEAEKAAAKAGNATVSLPVFPEASRRGEDGPTDFNDMAAISGLDAVASHLQEAARRLVGTRLPPSFSIRDRGVFYDDEGEGAKWVCSPLSVTAVTRSEDGRAWGRVLELTDLDGKRHTWVMPMQLVSGDGNEYRRVLLDLGLLIAPGTAAKNRLTTYIQGCEPQDRAVCVEKTGWAGGAYVLPDSVIGRGAGERVVYQSAAGAVNGYGVRGTLDGWRSEVAARCIGNSRLLFAVSVAFAPPLLELSHMEGGGIHFRGDSSIGKSTMLYVAATVWGGPDRVRRWRATDNGLEGTAQAHNDGLLCLDELKELDPKDAGRVVYMLANGQGKQRAGRSGEGREPATWRVLFLSTGELSIEDHIKDGGGRYHAGQAVRIADLPAASDAGMGVFDTLNGESSPVHLAQHLARVSKEHYGHPIRAFLERLTREREAVAVRIQEQRRLFSELVPSGADGQVSRVVDRFAIAAIAGELATEWGLTGWPEGQAAEAASNCFGAWIRQRGGTGSKENGDIVRQVRRFLQEHGDARFAAVSADRGAAFRVIARAGWKFQTGNDVAVFYIGTETFKAEVCKGFDYRTAARVLHDRGYLLKESGRSGYTVKTPDTVPDGGRPRCYAVSGRILEDED